MRDPITAACCPPHDYARHGRHLRSSSSFGFIFVRSFFFHALAGSLARITAIAGPQMPCAAFSTSAARSPMITQGAIVLPVVTRGMIEPSAIRRLSIP
jgi:hypothetical protein